MVDSCRQHIEKIRAEFNASPRVKDSLNNSIQALAKDLYSKNTHFIFELIQNAEDNSYEESEPSLSLRLTKSDPTRTQGSDGALIIQNNEVGFSSDNVEAICAVGKTTKSKIQGYIGEKGIGFKSVFRMTTTPHIISNGYHFCLPEYDEETELGYIVPRWINKPLEGFDPSQTTIILPLDKADFGYEKIEVMLRDIEPGNILFLSKLKKIQINTDTGDALTILKDDSKMPLVHILVEGEKQGKSCSTVNKYLLYSKTFVKPNDINHEKREGINDREVSIAFPLTEDNDGTGKIFAYLPVRSDTGLPFLINSDFILPSSREDIQDVLWNRWLMKCVANLVADALSLLKERGLLTVTLIETLARGVNKYANDKDGMFYPIVDEVRNALMAKELLPADDDSFVSARNAKLASADWLRKSLRQEQLKLLFQKELKWIHADITERGRHELWKYIREELKIEEVTPDGFARKVDSAFLNNQSDQWMIEFYAQLPNQKALWKKGSGTNWDADGPLRKKPFIRLQDGSHVRPFDDDDKPNAYLPAKTLIDSRLPTVKVEIAGHDEARRFLLSDLKILEFDIVAEVTEHVIPKYTSPSLPQTDEHVRDIEKILEAFQTDSQEKRKRLKDALQETPFILSRSSVSGDEAYRKPDALYFQDDSLEMYFSGNSEVGFISSIYQGSVLEMFANLSVRHEVRIDKRKPDDQGCITIRDSRGWHERGLFGFDPDIKVEGLLIALSSPTTEKSLFIWNKIVLPNGECIRGTIEKSSKQTYENSSKEERISESFGRLLIESKWLPGTDGKFHCPAELSLDELPDQFERSEKLADLLVLKKDIVAKLAEEAGVKPETLRYAQALEKYPDLLEEIKKREDVKFPTRTVTNPERRQERLTEQLSDAPNKEHEKRERSVRTTRGSIDPSLWLREQYTNEAGQMVCQICKKEMPFRKRDGQYYFEAVEAFSWDHFPVEHEAQFLALCPLCAAMYIELVKKDEAAMTDLRKALANMDSLEAPLRLGVLATTIRFVETHSHDMRTILREGG